VLALAATQGGAARASLLLLCYSLGLGIPFLLAGLGLGRAVGALGAVRRRYAWFAGVAGVAMVAIGGLVATDRWTRLIAPLLRSVGRFTPAL
jgi:cytochrome c-type biogenesis protein